MGPLLTYQGLFTLTAGPKGYKRMRMGGSNNENESNDLESQFCGTSAGARTEIDREKDLVFVVIETQINSDRSIRVEPAIWIGTNLERQVRVLGAYSRGGRLTSEQRPTTDSHSLSCTLKNVREGERERERG